jgi:hypothetical protein
MKRTFVAIAAVAASAAPGALAGNQIWIQADLEKSLPGEPRAALGLDTEMRYQPDGQLAAFVIRPKLSFEVNERLEVSGGYRYSQAIRTGADQIEHRLWQQAEYALFEAWGGEFSARTRLEQRYREGGSGTGWRVRQRIGLDYPLGGTALTLTLSEEIMLGLNTTVWGSDSGLQESRSRAGLEWMMAGTEWELGYLQRDRDGETSDHIVIGVSKEL